MDSLGSIYYGLTPYKLGLSASIYRLFVVVYDWLLQMFKSPPKRFPTAKRCVSRWGCSLSPLLSNDTRIISMVLYSPISENSTSAVRLLKNQLEFFMTSSSLNGRYRILFYVYIALQLKKYKKHRLSTLNHQRSKYFSQVTPERIFKGFCRYDVIVTSKWLKKLSVGS